MKPRNLLILLFLVSCLSAAGDVFSGASNMESLVPRDTPDGWATRGTPESFTKETLFEHINGQADLFLQYGFRGSIFTVYENKDAGRAKIDLDIYDMGDTTQAFGIFSRFRQDDHPAGIGLDSYLEDRYALFYKGAYFVVLQATEASPAALRQLAGMIESRIMDTSLPPKEIAYFPKNGLKPGSIEYYPQGLMGRQFLTRGFKAIYAPADKTEVKSEAVDQGPDAGLFLAVFADPEEAESALKTFEKDLTKKGAAPATISKQPGFETVRGEDPYQGKIIITHKGRYLAGAAGFEKEKDAEELLAELVKKAE